MLIELTSLHWIYVVFIVPIIGFMVKRRDTTLVCILGIFLLAIRATKNLTASISGVFNSFAFAISELLFHHFNHLYYRGNEPSVQENRV